jgi:hypothetical protein
MKIAALFVGRFKCFEDTYYSILQNVFSGHDVDVFFSHNAANTGDNLEDFKERYNVKASQSILLQIPEHIYNYTDVSNGRHGRHDHIWLMFYHINNGVRLIEKYCKNNDTAYDIVLYLRADMHFHSKVPFEIPRENTLYVPSLPDWGGINDQMAYGTLATMKKYAATFYGIDKYYLEDGILFHPERYTLHNIKVHGLHVVRFPISAYLDPARCD